MQLNTRMALNTRALLSLGKHPLSNRRRRANEDAQAFEMAAKLGDCLGLHAGSYDNVEQLKPFVGMDIGPVAILDIEKNADPVLALAAYFKQTQFDIILTGSRTEEGESSGMLPYLLAKALDIPIISQVCDASINPSKSQTSNPSKSQTSNIDLCLPTTNSINVTQALPRGARRSVTVTLPCILIIDANAPTARQSAFGPAARGHIEKLTGYSEVDHASLDFDFQPAQKKPKRMKKVKAKTAADRFKAATASQAKGGQVITPKTPEEGAQAILALLKEEGLIN